MKSLHLGIDIDDVIFPWYDRADTLCTIAGITNGKEPKHWEMWEDYGCTKQQWLDVIEQGSVSGDLYHAPPMPGANEALHRLHDAGHVIHLVTARGYFAHGDLIRKHTVDWLFHWDIPHDSLTFAKDKTFVKADVWVDDGGHNVDALTAMGQTVWLHTQQHNSEHEHPHRVESLEMFANLVLAGEWAHS